MSIKSITDPDGNQNIYCKNIIAKKYVSAVIPCADITFIDLLVPYQIQLQLANTYYPLLPSTTLLSNNSKFTQLYFSQPVAGVIKYLGPSQYATLDITLSTNVNQSADIYLVSIFKNGHQTNLQVYLDFVSNNVAVGTSIHDLIELQTGDELDIRMLNQTNPNRIVRIYNYHFVIAGSEIMY